MPEIEQDIELANRDGAASTVSSVGVKDSQNNVKLVVDLGDKRAMEIPLTGKLVIDLQQNSGTASTVNSVGVKDSQNNVMLVVDLGDKRAMEIPLTGKLVDLQQNSSAASTVNFVGAKDSQLLEDLGDKRAMEIPLIGKLATDLQQNSGTASTVNSVGAKDLQSNVKLVVDLDDKRAMEIPLTGKLVINQQQDSGSSPGDAEDTDRMRGWMMTVATLFVTLAYQAVTQPPGWMDKGDRLGVESASASSSHADPPAMPAPFPSPPATTVREARLAYTSAYATYVTLNTFTFGTALSLVIVLLLLEKKPTPPHSIWLVKFYVVLVACSVASTFVLGISDEPGIITPTYMVTNAVFTILYVIYGIPQWVLSIAKNIHMCFTRLKKFSTTRGLDVR